MAAGHDPTSSKSSLGAFEADKNKILTALLDTSEQSCSIVAIIGPCGVGKTYLAKEVYTSAKIQKHFDVHIWLSAASEYFDKHKALNHMREQLSIKEDTVTSSFLRGKRYCVVIDDLDCDNSSREEAWSVILKELPENYNGSRVLVTSRPEYGFSETRPILMLYEVGPRGDKESINILLNMVFPLQNDPMRRYVADENELLRLLMKFVKICKGLPWPLRILGGLLSAEGPPFSYSWNKVLRSIQAIEGGMSFIQFAMRYRDLPSHEMRAAFLYFLTFPQNAQIHAKYLVNLWIEENITEHHNSGMHILEDLVRRCITNP
ncbi:hypothetical protein LUZ61_008943 [Rhynchospora tenuis]|uniref:NB-ARC domain-containing protein n=1 Tax=Rhynchospora tenuis TaxID=198213 RepID=A0AAD6EY49_9POAL|nr:hypothetical protein LUZ61_008943 [Rhynchospora tenuis]